MTDTRTITVEALEAALHAIHSWDDATGRSEAAAIFAAIFAALLAEPAGATGSDWATAAAEVHRAFCDPEHELVGEWDREMAESLRRNGLRIVPAEPAGLRWENWRDPFPPEAAAEPAGSGLREALERFVTFHSGHVLPAELANTMALARAALAAHPSSGQGGEE